jgi:Flp pilus assembly protein TadG
MNGRTTSRALRADDGQTAVEFAFILPFLVFLILGIVQFGRAWYNYLTITDAARVGARQGAVSRTASGGPCSAATTKVNSLNVIPSGSTVSCSTPGGATTGQPVNVTITYTFTMGLPGYFGIPALNRSFTLTTTASDRIE